MHASSHQHKDIPFSSAAAKSLQLCQTLCDPIDSSPPGSSAPGILQARTLEWVAISFPNAWKLKSESEVVQSCPTLSDPMDCSPPVSSVHAIFQARVLEWGAIAFSLLQLYSLTIIKVKQVSFSPLASQPWTRLRVCPINSPKPFYVSHKLFHALLLLVWHYQVKSTEDEMVGWHHPLNGPEFEQIVKDREAQSVAVHGVVKRQTQLSDSSLIKTNVKHVVYIPSLRGYHTSVKMLLTTYHSELEEPPRRETPTITGSGKWLQMR